MTRADDAQWQLLNEAVISHQGFIDAQDNANRRRVRARQDLRAALTAGVEIEELSRGIGMSVLELQALMREAV